jgi:putative transposase
MVERYIGSVPRACLDHMLIFGGRQLHRVIKAYVDYFNRSRPHEGISQNVPCGSPSGLAESATGKIISFTVLNGLHHQYRRAA